MGNKPRFGGSGKIGWARLTDYVVGKVGHIVGLKSICHDNISLAWQGKTMSMASYLLSLKNTENKESNTASN